VTWFTRRRRGVLADAERAPHRGARSSAAASENVYSITCSLGEFGMIGIPWQGTSWEDARDSFMEYLFNDEEFNDTGGRYADFRSLYVRFNGQSRLLTFRTSWITGFTVN
jgi:hypothetical protein